MGIFKTFVETQLRKTRREHVEDLLVLMDQRGYYTARCGRHHRYEGGTLQHSIEVLLYALEHNTYGIPEDSIVVACLLHDLCNVQGFRHISRHGSRSVRLATQVAGFHLTHDEYQAILWHMHGWSEKGTLGSDFDATTHCKLWQLLRDADKHSAGHPMRRTDIVNRLIAILNKERNYLL